MKKFTQSIFALVFVSLQISCFQSAFAQQKGEPFEDIDATWQNGNDRRDSSVFKNMKYFTPSILMDVS